MKKLQLSFSLSAILLLMGLQTVFAQDFNMQLRSTLEFPGQTLANICGYAQGGHEYALLGASQGLIIVDVTNPDAPTTIQQIPGPDNLWKEIKVYGHYAYVTSEGGQGVQVVDMSSLPTPTSTYQYYKGDGAISGTLNRIHALHIDVTKGFMYLYGSNLFNGGAVICELNTDPYNPRYVGKYNTNGYIHDGYVDNDTLYAAHINDGFMSMVDMSDKQNPNVLGTVTTPGAFTHNTWLLSDRKTILTTDEEYPSFVTAYDVSDPTDIKELDRISTGDGNNSIGHNVHILNDYAITSWYIDGFVVIDAHRPDNLVEVARYDTWPGGGEFDGCWGVYPYLPSGNLIASNIPNTGGGVGKMFVCTPTYVRACYLEGKILNGCTGLPMLDATVTIEAADPVAKVSSKTTGVFKTGVAAPGTYTVTVSKQGYETQTFTVNLTPGNVTPLNLTLEVANAVDISCSTFNVATQAPVANTFFIVSGNGQKISIQSDASGNFDLSCFPAGTYKASSWGLKKSVFEVTNNGAVTILFEPGYYDDFLGDLGWSSTGLAASGQWVLGEPIGTNLNAELCNPEFDVDSDDNTDCYVTGNGGGSAGNDDVDNGEVTLISPPMNLAAYQDATLSFWYWFFNGSGQGAPNDNLTVTVTNGTETATVLTNTTSESAWRYSGEISLKSLISLNDNVRVRFTTGDQQTSGNVVEAAVDVFSVTPATVSVKDHINPEALLSASPNPSASAFLVNYDWNTSQNMVLEVRNTLGQIVLNKDVSEQKGKVLCGEQWPAGTYFAVLRSGAGQSGVLKLVKR